jgi:hypothetical protein
MAFSSTSDQGIVMKTLSLTIIVGLAACLLLAGAQRPAFAARTTSVQCFNPQLVAERPAGPVTLPTASANRYSAWSGRFRMALDNSGRFSVQCSTLGFSGGFGPPTLGTETVTVDCGHHVNLVRARRGPNNLLEFECIARDHRR